MNRTIALSLISAVALTAANVSAELDRNNNLMQDLNLNPEEVPLLAGELVHADQEGRCAGFNKIMAKLPETLPNSHVISSSGCTTGDRMHFDSAGSREFGKRYGEKMLSLLGVDEAHTPSPGVKAE